MRARPFHMQMLVLCVAVHTLQFVLGSNEVLGLGALYGPDVVSGQWWRVLTAGFLHGGILHLGVNMFALVALGRGLEALLDRSGRWLFPALYLGSLLGGSLGALLLEFDIPAVGASGAIFGLLGASVSIPQRLGMGWNGFGVVPWLGLNLVFTFAAQGISRGGHIGGLVAGLAIGYLLAPRLSLD
jgi:membrane associated rhomboid family serine protease